MNQLLFALCLVCVLALTTSTGKKRKRKPLSTAEDYRAMHKSMLAKHNTDQDGKLRKAELSKMTAEDKVTWQKANPRRGKTEIGKK